jgi:hypothetical protein
MVSNSERYGSLKRGVHVAGYTMEGAWADLESLLKGDGWMEVGNGFTDINKFLKSIDCFDDKFRPVADPA